MQSLPISEIPSLLRGGNIQDSEVSEAQNASVFDFNERKISLIKTLKAMPEVNIPPKVHRYDMDADGLQPNGTLRTPFNGRNAVKNGTSPVIDFSTGSWDAPLDTWTRDAEVATISAGSFIVGQYYKIASVGTTDFTAIGAPSNTAGVHFKATGVGAGDGLRTMQFAGFSLFRQGRFLLGNATALQASALRQIGQAWGQQARSTKCSSRQPMRAATVNACTLPLAVNST